MSGQGKRAVGNDDTAPLTDSYNALHWVCDVVYDEDRHQLRTGAGPQTMATLRNTAISLLRLTGHTRIAAALRHHARDDHRVADLILTA